MHDYRLKEREQPERHPDAVKRLTEPPRRTDRERRIAWPQDRWTALGRA